MRRFFPSYHIRQLEIIHFAYVQNGKFFNIEDLAEKLSFSVPCIKEDILTLSEKFSPFMNVEWDKKKLSITFQPNITEYTFIQLFFKDSNMIHILKSVFFDPLSDPQQLMNQLMLSKTSFYRLIRRFNEDTTPDYRFELSMTPFAISGDEVMIRSMYHELFKTISKIGHWPFSDISRNDVHHLLDHIERITNHSFERSKRLNGSFAFAVNLYRTRQLNTISKIYIPKTYQLHINRILEDDLFQKEINYFEQGFNIRLSYENLQQLLFGILPCGDVKNYKELLMLQDDADNLSKNLHQLGQYVQWVSQTYHLTHTDEEQIIYMLYDLIHQQIVVPEYQPLLHQPYTEFIQRFDFIPTLFFKKTYGFLKRYSRKAKINHSQEHINQIIVHLLMHWTQLLDAFENSQSKPNLLILSDINTQHEAMIERILRAHLGHRYNLVQAPDDFYEQNSLLGVDADIIVSNYYVKSVPGKTNLIFDHIPTQSTLQDLERIVDDFHLDKLRHLTLSSEIEPL